MSLISTASEWKSDNQTRKRVPTMKRMTAKIRPYDNTSSSDPVGYNDSVKTEHEYLGVGGRKRNKTIKKYW